MQQHRFNGKNTGVYSVDPLEAQSLHKILAHGIRLLAAYATPLTSKYYGCLAAQQFLL